MPSSPCCTIRARCPRRLPTIGRLGTPAPARKRTTCSCCGSAAPRLFFSALEKLRHALPGLLAPVGSGEGIDAATDRRICRQFLPVPDQRFLAPAPPPPRGRAPGHPVRPASV